MKKLRRVQQVLLAVNRQYIDSASQDDAYRTEPPFQLQGSYRNMNKLAEKIVPVMNDRELEALLDDHYLGESQTLTTGAEHNLLKLAELRGVMSEEQQRRWTEIKRGFARVQAMGGAEDDPAVRLIGQLSLMSDRLQDIGATITAAASSRAAAETAAPASGAGLGEALAPYLDSLQQNLAAITGISEQASDDRVVKSAARAVTKRLDGLGERLAELCQAVAGTPATGKPAAAPSSIDFSPYLDKLDVTLQRLVDAPRGTEIVQLLSPGVYEVLAQLAETVGDNLLPLIKGIGRAIKDTEAASDRKLVQHLDRSLKNLDMLKDLVASLRKIDTRALGSGPG